MINEYKKYVLFSPIGDTDPIRNDYDGPMLHIARRYKPWKVVLYLTQKMQANEEDFNNWYSGYIRRLAPDTEIELIKGGEERVFDFCEFHTSYREHIARLAAEAPDSAILLNMSSGTPQMISALSIIAATHPYGNDRLLPIQVVTPVNMSNRDVKHMEVGEVRESMEDLGENTNRCVKVDFENYIQSFVRESVKRQIEAMDYSGALELCLRNKVYFSQTFLHALNGARLRASCRLDEALKEFQKAGWQNERILAIEHAPYKDYSEYFLHMRRNFLRADYAAFVLSLPPLTIKMQLHTLKNECGFNIENYCLNNKDRLDSALLHRKLPELAGYLESPEALNGILKDEHISVFLLNYILKYYCEQANDKKNGQLAQLQNEYAWVRSIEVRLRHPTAHTLKGLSETDIKTECDVQSVSEAWKRFSKLFFKVFADSPIKKGILSSYDSMNTKLTEMLVITK